jgi:hypothetical protein
MPNKALRVFVAGDLKTVDPQDQAVMLIPINTDKLTAKAAQAGINLTGGGKPKQFPQTCLNDGIVRTHDPFGFGRRLCGGGG